ncbi:MAG: LysE family transporter [Bacteroidia bacterium]|nr:LysE family transporter [Bacteroidia bacterium]
MLLSLPSPAQLSLAALWGLGLSIVGTLPLGMINLTVANTSIHKGIRTALLVALGASLVETLQVLASVVFAENFTRDPAINQTLAVVAIPVFWGLGIYFLLAPATPPGSSRKINIQGVALGALITLLNLLAYPYWIFYSSYLRMNGWLLPDPVSLSLFVAGTGIGTFAALALYAQLAQMVATRASSISKVTHRLMALVCILLGIRQIVEVFMHP